MEQDKIFFTDFGEMFNKLKIIVMIEEKPLSDKFVQVMLTPAQFNFVRKAILSCHQSRPRCGTKEVIFLDRHARAHFRDVPENYSEKKISEELKKTPPTHCF